MIHTNTAELNQLYSTFNRVWGAGGNAVLNLKTEDGKVTATLELQLGHPEDPRPGAKPEAEPAAAYQQHARRHRGPGRRARDSARRDAWRARRQETLPSPQATPPPPPLPPPPIEPLWRLITVLRNTSEEDNETDYSDYSVCSSQSERDMGLYHRDHNSEISG